MKIILTTEESEEYFYNALCNGLGYFQGYGLDVTYTKTAYKKAKAVLEKEKKSVCYEDVLLQILKNGGSLTVIDDENGIDPSTITIADVHERVAETPTCHLMDMVNENDDAETADVILQTVFFKEVLFG